MRKYFVFGLFFAFAGPVHGANDDVACTQAYLSYRGFNAGTADGLMGPMTRAAANDYLNAAGADLPELSDASAAQWCAHSKEDAEFKTLQEYDFQGYGIIPRDILHAALDASPRALQGACGPVPVLDELDRLNPIKRISGFVSRMDNADQVAGAREVTEFAKHFSQAGVAAFVTKNDAAKTQLVRILAKWARAGAFLDTASCVKPNGGYRDTPECTSWKRDDGQDLSAAKDAEFTTFLMAGLVRNYLALLSDHEPTALSGEHRAIKGWITNGFAKRLKRPTREYFGFGLNVAWFWPAINLDMVNGRIGEARRKLEVVEDGFRAFLNTDGSIKDRTTRGNRALWYQYTSIGEVVMTFEMMRAVEMPVDQELETRLHAAVDLFLRANDDYSVIHPWAQQRHQASYDGKNQDWERFSWPDKDFAGSWLHVYPYRYPDHPNTQRLSQKVRWYSRSARMDTDYGFGAGCLYNLAGGRAPG